MKYQFINLTSGRTKLVFFTFLVLFGYLIASFAALAICKLAGYDQIMERITNPVLTDIDSINVQRIVQISLQIGLFLIGPIIYMLLVEQHPVQKLGLNQNPFQINYLLIFVLMLVCLPAINLTHTLNQAMHLPSWLSSTEKWMQDKENSANELTDAFLKMKTFKDLGINLLMFGLLPALGEELFFRGALFSILKDWTKRKHLTIFITAFIFSAIHLQFYGFLPRFLLGVGFGYLFIFTGSLWAPILAHFINNSLAVVVAFFFFQGKSAVDQDDFGSVDNLWLNLLSIGVTLYLFRLISQRKWSTIKPDELRREWDSNP
jgi:membrane protease YdiL (CAAX protease family)